MTPFSVGPADSSSLSMEHLCTGYSSLTPQEKKTRNLDESDANGVVETKTKVKVHILESGTSLYFKLVDDSLSVLFLGRLCNIMGCTFSWFFWEERDIKGRYNSIACNFEDYIPTTAAAPSTRAPQEDSEQSYT